MPIDTSMYGTQAPQPFNALDAFGKFAAIQNAQNQNKLFQQEFGARQAMGPIIQGAIDPATGQLDTNKLLQGLSSNPATAFKAPELAKQALEMQAQQTTIAGAQQTQGQARVKAIGDAVTTLLPLGADVTPKDVTGKVIDLVGQGALDTKSAATFIASLPQDGASIHQLLRQKQLQLMPTSERQTAVFGSNENISNGSQIITGVRQSPMNGGTFAANGAVNLTTDPATRAQLVDVYQKQPDGTYQAVKVPRSALPGASGAAGAPGTAQPTQPTQPGAPAAGAAPAGASPAGAPVLAAPPPGVSESQGADVTRFKADQGDSAAAQTRVQSLQKAKTALEALRDDATIGTGHGTEGLSHLRSVITSLTGLDTANTMNRDEAKKYLLDYAKSQGAAAHSDAQLNAALGSNASTEISNAAARDVVTTNIGRERQRIAQVAEAPNPTGIGYGAHAQKFASETDPRAFAWNEYSDAERQKILSGLKGAAKDKFARSLLLAEKHGFVQRGQ